MFKVPHFSLQNYEQIMGAPFQPEQTSSWIPLPELIKALPHSLIHTYRTIDPRTFGDSPPHFPSTPQSIVDGKAYTHHDLIVRSKLLIPSLRACTYFQWNIGGGSHAGIDIMMPQGSPIKSITAGKVIRIKTRDNVTPNEGNCICVEAPDGHVVAYEHLENIHVTLGQSIQQWQTIGTCGTTGHSTQYHLHLQVDKPTSPFHPYRSQNISDVLQHTVDPFGYIYFHSGFAPFIDFPFDRLYQEAISGIHQAGIIQGFNGHIFPNNTLQRYEMALLMDRILQTFNIYSNLPVQLLETSSYTDVPDNDPELLQALQRLQKYGVMKGHDQKFYPFKDLLGEELLAILGRIFFHLQDSHATPRYDPYLQSFRQKNIISASRPYVQHTIPRKDVFLLLYQLLTTEGYLSS